MVNQSQIRSYIEKLTDWMVEREVDALYLSSFDEWLNEYVPLKNCPRYFATGFTGSVAEVLLFKDKKVHLMVDGRYHEQADGEVDLALVKVVKCQTSGAGVKESVRDFLRTYKCKKLAVVGSRTYLKDFEKMSAETAQTTMISEAEICELLPLSPPREKMNIEEVDIALTGKSTADKLREILAPGEGIFLSQLDSISWLINGRGYQLPYQSAVVGKAFATHEKVTLLGLGQESDLPTQALEKVFYDPQRISLSDFHLLSQTFDNLTARPGGILLNHAIKNSAEIKSMEESFKRADQAIFKTMKWVRDKWERKEFFSELDFYECAENNYQKMKVRCQSFHTIAGVGSNTSLVHFSASSDTKKVAVGDMLLLDSGGYWESGYATDTTRVGLYGDSGDSKQKKLYTLVLKGLLRAQNALFKKGTMGQEIDLLARSALKEHGLDYPHGTGHGVGINVHEGGFLIGPTSKVPLQAGLVGSIEPGVYIPGYGGIRLENIVVVEETPTDSEMLYFRPLVYIGLEGKLIDRDLLDQKEKAWLLSYEQECARRGTSFSLENNPQIINDKDQ